jgi:hypothetical protein
MPATTIFAKPALLDPHGRKICRRAQVPVLRAGISVPLRKVFLKSSVVGSECGEPFGGICTRPVLIWVATARPELLSTKELPHEHG